jgi:AraC-like DNA-binding protein
MSRSAFSEHFSRAFGRTAMDLFKEVRLRKAAELLASTRRPIKAIAIGVGYQSRSHFARAFKAVHGLHPSAYREQRSQPVRPPKPSRAQRSVGTGGAPGAGFTAGHRGAIMNDAAQQM